MRFAFAAGPDEMLVDLGLFFLVGLAKKRLKKACLSFYYHILKELYILYETRNVRHASLV